MSDKTMNAVKSAKTLYVCAILAVIAATAPLLVNIILDMYSETLGEIRVESPQVFTRERLATDRAMHDIWLQNVLNTITIDKIAPAQITTSQSGIDVNVGGKDATEARPAPLDPPKENKFTKALSQEAVATQDLAFSFSAANYLREIVRQEIIANQLDDRHDYQGTTLLQLKFDAAILPGQRTRRGAKIEVSLAPPPELRAALELIDGEQQADSAMSSSVPLYVKKYYSSSGHGEYDIALRYLKQEFAKFRSGFADRLKKRFDSIATTELTDSDSTIKRLVSEILAQGRGGNPSSSDPEVEVAALGLAKSIIRFERAIATYFDVNKVVRPDISEVFTGFLRLLQQVVDGAEKWPLDKIDVFMTINYNMEGHHNAFPLELQIPLILRRICLQNQGDAIAATNGRLPCTVSLIGSKTGTIRELDLKANTLSFLLGLDHARLKTVGTTLDSPAYVASGECLDLLEKSTRFQYIASFEGKNVYGRKGAIRLDFSDKFWSVAYAGSELQSGPGLKSFLIGSDCNGDLRSMTIPISLFRFIEAARSPELYAYGLMPRAGVFLKINDAARSATGNRTAGGRDGDLRISAALEERTVSSDAGVRSIGFSGDQSKLEGWRKSIYFGWALTPNDGQKQLWRRNFLGPSQHSLSAIVRVPAWWNAIHLVITTSWEGSDLGSKSFHYDVSYSRDFESLEKLLGLKSSQPFVFLAEMPSAISLPACEAAYVPIRGERLWKNSVVIMNGIKASTISVLPDMRGILAYFEKGSLRPTVSETQKRSGLFIYTTEGAAKIDIPIEIFGSCGASGNARQ